MTAKECVIGMFAKCFKHTSVNGYLPEMVKENLCVECEMVENQDSMIVTLKFDDGNVSLLCGLRLGSNGVNKYISSIEMAS